MHTLKQIPSQRVFIFLLAILAFAPPVAARSVYVITDRLSTVNAYHIAGHRIEYPTPAEDLPRHGSGAVGLAIDQDSDNSKAFSLWEIRFPADFFLFLKRTKICCQHSASQIRH